jgi:hypothetical protein
MSAPDRKSHKGGAEHTDTRTTAGAHDGGAVEPSRGTPAGNPVGGRVAVGDAESSRRHTPSVEPGLENAPIQHEREDDAPVLPANASGHDKVSADEEMRPIDAESMYDRRPSQDKDRPPSEGAR